MCETRAKDPYHITENIIVLNLRLENGSIAPVRIPESDIVFYEEAFANKSPEDRRKIVLAKTDISEHPLIVQARENRARTEIERYLKEGNIAMILELIDDLNFQSIEQLPVEVLTNVLKSVSQNSEAITQIWNKNNPRFHTVKQHLPDWILADLEFQKMARYKYDTAAKKVDTIIIRKLHEEAAMNTGDERIARQQAFATTMERILLSDAYKKAHTTEKSYDNHLQSILRIITDDRFDVPIRQQLAETVGKHYGAEMSMHWQHIIEGDELLLDAAINAFPEAFQTLVDTMQFKAAQHERIPGVADSTIIRADKEKVFNHLTQQASEKLEPLTMTLLVEIGRVIEDSLAQTGIIRAAYHGERQLEPIDKERSFDAVVRVDKVLNLESGQVSEEFADDPKVMQAILEQVKALSEIQGTADIRIILGGFATQLMIRLNRVFGRKDDDDEGEDVGPELRNRLVFSFYNQQEKKYIDMRMKPKKAA